MSLETQTPNAPVVVVTPSQSKKTPKRFFALSSSLFSVVEIKGTDNLDLVSRISASTLNPLNDQSDLVFTDAKGRYVALATVWRDKTKAALVALNFSKTSKPLAKHILQYKILEDVEVEDVSQKMSLITTFGISSGDITKKVPFAKVVKSPFSREDDRCEVVVGCEQTKDAILALNSLGFSEISLSEMELLRIKKGVPMDQKELTSDYNPLEAGLGHLIDLDRCYIGQEVLARLDTYDKLKRTLCRFEFSKDEVFEGSAIFCEEKVGFEVGLVTSSKDFFGLGYVKKGFLDKPLTTKGGTTVVVKKLAVFK